MSLAPALGAEALLAHRLEQRILPGLERMQRALDALGRPEKRFASVLVLGTNGKGSTAALLAGILSAHGARVGLYTSPHLVRVEERIRVDGVEVGPRRLAELVAGLNRFPELSYFETLTGAAVLEFAESAVDVAVMEAGLGGRWDASSAASPAVALLTNVGTDHQKWLGEGRVAIAAEKAAALRGLEAVVGAWDAEVEPVIRASADRATPLSVARDWATVTGFRAKVTGRRAQGAGHRETNGGEAGIAGNLPAGSQRVRFAVAGVEGEAELPLLGPHQLANLELALAGAAALARHGLAPALRADAVRVGIEGVAWPGRLQWCHAGTRRLLVDGAHNREAVAALAAALDAMGLSGTIDLLFSCLDDKPLEAMAALLRPRVLATVVAPVASPRARAAEDLAAAFPGCRTAPGVADAVATLAGGRPVLVTGSLRLAGEVLAAIGRAHA